MTRIIQLRLRDGLYMIAADYIAQINSNDYIQVQQDLVQGTYYDSPDGQSVNRQVWLQSTFNAESVSA